MTVFYKNGYHFTKITTLLCKFYLKMSKIKLEFYLIFTCVSTAKTSDTGKCGIEFFCAKAVGSIEQNTVYSI
jgi:hypothetical protein